jgi:hypothetical protein
MTTKKILFLSLIATLSIIYSCGKDENETAKPTVYNYEYFPLQVGKYRIFQMDSILFDTIAGRIVSDSIRTYLREEIKDSFVNTLGINVYRIERYERKKLTDPWKILDVVSAEREVNRGIRTESNFRLVKLVFPFKERTTWKSTLLIDDNVEVKVGKKTIKLFQYWESVVKSLGKPETILNKKFDDVVVISHANEDNKIELRRITEKYAKGVGLISNEMEIMDTQAINSNASWRNKAQKGFILRQYLIEYN